MTIELVLICIVVGFAVGAIVYFLLNIVTRKHYSDTIDFDRASKRLREIQSKRKKLMKKK